VLLTPLSQTSERTSNYITYLKDLRERIILQFESLEPQKRFERKMWHHKTGGYGEISKLQGDLFEKAAVNFSAVSGDSFPLDKTKGPYFATGISLITHMRNPFLPTVHMNLRYIELENSAWFGGGYDLTPMGFPFQEDTDHFHQTAKKALDKIDINLYKSYSQAAKEYFYLPHYEQERGVGGLFFDYLAVTSQSEHIFKTVGESFLEAIMPIYEWRKAMEYGEKERALQLKSRGRYVEFNLLYDRGTRFGFFSGGNPEAILCSLPPLVSW
jgi:coproporphyrinogen III oxidase